VKSVDAKLPGFVTTGNLGARRVATGKAYRDLMRQLEPLRAKDPKLIIHRNRKGATLPLFVIETLGSLKQALRALPGVKSVTPVRQVHRIA